MQAIIGCPICGSEKIYGKKCNSCLDLNFEEWAIKDAVEAFVADYISLDELERQIEIAFVDPPKKRYDHIVYR